MDLFNAPSGLYIITAAKISYEKNWIGGIVFKIKHHIIKDLIINIKANGAEKYSIWEHSGKDIEIEEIEIKKYKKIFPKIKIGNNIVDFTDEGIKVGCEEISKEVIKQIYEQLF